MPMILMLVGETCFLAGAIWYAVDASHGAPRPAKSEATANAASSAAEIAQLMAGGENFCFFFVLGTKNSQNGLYQLGLEATAPVYDVNYWVSPAPGGKHLTGDDSAYWTVDVQKPLIPIVHAGGHNWNRALPPGEYTIEYDGRNGHWDQYLKFSVESNGRIKQTSRVTGFGGKILRSETTREIP